MWDLSPARTPALAGSDWDISASKETRYCASLVEAAQAAVRYDPDWRRRYLHLVMRRERRIAKVAMARRLAVRLYWMWRKGWEYSQTVEFGSYAGQLVTGHGAN